MEILCEYWRSDKAIVNLGDYVTVVVLKAMGFEPISYYEAQQQGRLDEFDSCFLIAGTLLDANWFGRIKKKKTVWGAGSWGDSRFTRAHLADCRVHAVRGPETVKHLSLSEDLPVGDPGILLPTFLPMARKNEREAAYVPHFNDRNSVELRTLRDLGVNRVIDIAIARDEFWERVAAIVESQFVLTSSLHGAIVAQAYGTPWALCVPKEFKQSMPLKWKDWFSYLGIEGKGCADLQLGWEWWQSTGRFGRIDGVQKLLGAFPEPSRF